MTSNRVQYDELVAVLDAAGADLGQARFVGRAVQPRFSGGHLGPWLWSGVPLAAGFGPETIADGGELLFNDGARGRVGPPTGKVATMSLGGTPDRKPIPVEGTGPPPRIVDA
jgi:hypothetical protein